MLLAMMVVSGLTALTALRFSITPGPTALVEIRYEVIEEALQVQAVALRREEVVVAPWGGNLRRLAAHGERVRAGFVVAELTNPQVGGQVGASLSSWSTANAARLEALRASINSRHQRISEVLDEVARSAAVADEKALRLALEALERLNSENRDEETELQSLESRLSKMIARRARAEEAANRANLPLKAPEAGVVSFQVDGLEERLRPESRDELRASALLGLAAKTLTDPESRSAKMGQPLFKIVDTKELHLAVILEPVQTPVLPSGAPVKVRLPSGVEAEARVEGRGTTDPDGRAVLILRAPNLAGELAMQRRFQATLVLRRAEGPVAPVSSLATRDGRPGVFVVIGGQAYWKPVQPGAVIGDRVTLPQFSPGTMVVIEPSSVKQGQKVP